MALCTSLQVARQREPVEKREALLELVDNEELELVDKKEFELVDKKELELVSKTIWKRRMRDTNILWRGPRGHWWQHNMGVRG